MDSVYIGSRVKVIQSALNPAAIGKIGTITGKDQWSIPHSNQVMDFPGWATVQLDDFPQRYYEFTYRDVVAPERCANPRMLELLDDGSRKVVGSIYG